MKIKFGRLAKSLVTMVVLPFLALSALAQAEEVGVADVEDASVVVEVIVNIDKGSRAITLKKEDGGEWVFLAGPEVRNFDQLKRGDQVIVKKGVVG